MAETIARKDRTVCNLEKSIQSDDRKTVNGKTVSDSIG